MLGEFNVQMVIALVVLGFSYFAAVRIHIVYGLLFPMIGTTTIDDLVNYAASLSQKGIGCHNRNITSILWL